MDQQTEMLIDLTDTISRLLKEREQWRVRAMIGEAEVGLATMRSTASRLAKALQRIAPDHYEIARLQKHAPELLEGLDMPSGYMGQI